MRSTIAGKYFVTATQIFPRVRARGVALASLIG